MRHLIPAVLLSVIVGSLATSQASADGFIALEGTSLTAEDTDNNDLNPIGGRLRVGLQLSPRVDLEGHYSRSSDDDTESGNETKVSSRGAYLKGYLPIGTSSALFIAGGYAEVDIDLNGVEANTNNGLSWGAGLQTQMSEFVYLTADYTRFTVDDEDEGSFPVFSTINAGLKISF